jgi:sec-independent protein translocase protein TatA
MPGGWEWIILVVVALVIFGGTRLANVGKNAGKAIHDFKEEISKGGADDDTSADAGVSSAGSASPDADAASRAIASTGSADPSGTDTLAEREPQ